MYRLSNPQKLIYEMEKYAGGAVAVICGSVLLKGKRSEDEMTHAVHEIFRRNDALRTRIMERDGQVWQEIGGYQETSINRLCFDSREALTAYAEEYAKVPVALDRELCEIQLLFLPGQCGILAKCHHMIGDAWTLTLIASQLCALLAGEEPPAFPYSDYLERESEYVRSDRLAKDKAFFLDQFKSCPEAVYLSEKPGDSYEAKRLTFHVGIDHTALIRTYAKEHGTSPFALFFTAVAIYFSRVRENAGSFYIGTPVLNRGTFREKHTMGMFINTVPVLAQIDYDKSFAGHLAGMQREALSALRHQKFHYNDILTAIRQEYGFTEKLHDVVLSYQNAVVTGAEAGIETAWYHSGIQVESLQIHIDDRDSAGNFRVQLDYRTDKFTSLEVERTYHHILYILLDAISDDTKKPGELKLLSDEEKKQLLHDFNDTAAEYPRDKCVHTLFEEQAAETPDKTAVIACDRTLTYGELNREANRIAHGLIGRGVRPGDIVAFALPRDSRLVAVMFGILKAGAAYLPIDPDYPQERVSFMLKDSGAEVFLTERELPDLMAGGECGNPDIAMSSDSLCYCIYTSGSTGRPKGVTTTHSNAVNFCCNGNSAFHQALKGCCDCVLATNNVVFDITLQEIHLPLLHGKQIFLMRDDVLITKEEAHRVDMFCGNLALITTPTRISLLLGDDGQAPIFKKCRVIMVGAEKFTPALYRKMRKLTEARIFNGYGPTETTCGSCYQEVVKDEDITIGRPIANTQIYILDQYMNPVPIGVTGELCIAGDGVGAGYLNRPELTAEKFVENPFGEGTLYKTGDLAYWRADGNIVYVGRNDFQVKLRGLRVELGEIESAIASVEGVGQAVVVVRKDETGRQLICAFYTGSGAVETDAIKAAILERLPRYMMPHIFTRLETLPLTPSGKVDRKSLPEVDLSACRSDTEYAPPSTEKETVLADAVSSVLGVEKAGMLDSFFDLGGDSLRAIELAAALERTGWHTEVKTIFDTETLRELAAKLIPAETGTASPVPAGDIPATPAQMRVYTAQNMGGGTAYNVPYGFQVEELDPVRLQIAVDEMVARHEILRTRFEDRDGQVIQVADDAARCRVEKLDSGDISAFIRPFDLGTAPLLRVGYFENTVLLDMHHIITDGGSLPVFLREMNELYMGRELETRPVQYREFAAGKADYAKAEQYWLSVFAGEPPVLELPADHPRKGRQSYEGDSVYENIDRPLHEKICAKSRGLGITPYAFYMGAFFVLLSKFSGSEDIVVGTPASGRSGRFLSTLGMFVNTLALRGKPEGEKSVRGFLEEVRTAAVDALANQNYPYGELVRKLGIRPEGRNPLFDVMFAYQSGEMAEAAFGDRPAEVLPVPTTTSKYDFTFSIIPKNGGAVLMAEYCTALFREETIRRFIEGYKLLLSGMLDTEKRIRELSAMTEAEREILLHDFNDTAAEYPRDKCVHTLFEEQAAETPDKTAVIACDRTLTYGELNREANRIAHGLIGRGVRPGDIVAFALPRDSHLVPVMFGILKAGAAYLPIDPDYPQERISFMRKDSGAKLFVTDMELPDLLAGEDCHDPEINLSSDSLCYCIYTSGSTGKPKGVTATHSNAVNFCCNNSAFHQAMQACCDCVLATNNIVFDITMQELHLPLLQGKQVFLIKSDVGITKEEASRLDKSCDNLALITTPTKISLCLNDNALVPVFKKCRVIMVGAEKFTPALYRKIRERTEARIFNGYGPTEATCGSCYQEVVSENITIGRPIANTQIYILDQYMNPVLIGVTGELCIAGDGVGAGYLNRPELTAEKFVENPFGEGTLYKTGDLAYWRADGNIVYVGRNDFQVKIRGLRVELGEIESAISSVEGVGQAVVVVRKDETGRQLICAFYTGSGAVEMDAIKAAIREKLPRYMMPHIFTRLEALPLTPSGKVDRKSLPEVDLTDYQVNTEYVLPKGQMEKGLVDIMEQVLGYSPIGREDDFFDLGGDSLKAIEFVSKAHTEGIYFTIQNIFDYPTAAALREYIESGDKSAVSYQDTDFTSVNMALAKNRTEIHRVPDKIEIENLLLTGATGFLGIHILADYLENDRGTVYCLVRGQNQADSERRLEELLHFYFGKKYSRLLGSRIQVLCGDLQKELFGLGEPDYKMLLEKMDTVINAAATVKHYGSYKFFHEANVGSVERLIRFCRQGQAKLIHVSTLSVSGNGFDTFEGYVSPEEKHFYEDSLYIGQPFHNVYARSKFEAEKMLLEAVADGMHASIMRMGNLTNRASDGVFQVNHETNAAVQRIKAVLELGVVPDYLIAEDMYVEFTPIDEAARAIVLLAQHFDPERTVFHINSTRIVYLDKLTELFTALGYPVRAVPGKKFVEALHRTAKQSGMKHIFETFIDDLDKDDRLNYDSNIHIGNSFTEEYLRKFGFTWGEIGVEYLKKYVDYFERIGYWRKG